MLWKEIFKNRFVGIWITTVFVNTLIQTQKSKLNFDCKDFKLKEETLLFWSSGTSENNSFIE